MLTLAIRAIIVYLIVIIVFRLMGKRQIGQMQPFELVLTLIVADLATIPIGESAVPLLHGLISLLTLVVIHFFLTLLNKKSTFFSKIISGKPVIIISPNGIDYENLKKLNISVDDIFESIRGCGYFSLDQVEYAIIETSGVVNVLTKKDFTPLVVGDISKKDGIKLDQNLEQNVIPVTLISEGALNKENLKVAQVDENFVQKILKEADAKNVKDVLILTLDGNGKVYFQLKNENFKVFSVDYKKGAV